MIEQEQTLETLTKESKRMNNENDLLRAKVSELQNSLNISRMSMNN